MKRNRRMIDRYSVTNRLSWRFAAFIDKHAGSVVGTLAVTVFWALLGACLLAPQP